jgi:hypothetical protein
MSINEGQPFARKLLSSTMADMSSIRNEIRAITKLCDGSHVNIIKVLRCGEYQDLSVSYAYIDMELCSLNLDEYIKGKWALYSVDGVLVELRGIQAGR